MRFYRIWRDRVAANGDTANKIGTSGVAIRAKKYGFPFYVHAPLSTINMNTPTGDEIHIELRKGEEIYEMWYKKPMAPKGIKTYNPAFDVTDAEFHPLTQTYNILHLIQNTCYQKSLLYQA